MILVIGGHAQGKREYVMGKYRLTEDQIAQGADCSLGQPLLSPAIDGLHHLVRRLMLEGITPEAYIRQMLESTPDMIVICDEIGCGIVPIDRFERDWRETTGRLCCTLAQHSQRVERIIAGIPTVIKEDNS